MSLCMQTYTSLPPLLQDQFLPLISSLSLCGLTERSSPVNLIYPLFRLCLPPASHIFSTWQNLNLSADGAHSCFLWLVSGGRGRGEWMGVEETHSLCVILCVCLMWQDKGTEQDRTIYKPLCFIMTNEPAVRAKINNEDRQIQYYFKINHKYIIHVYYVS